MALDEAILVEARRAQDVMAAARREADRARADFIRHIRRLHAAGASLREVGESLGLSHQRVHQIIDAGRPRSDEQTIICCNFCGRAEPEVSKVIAGPGIYICNLCVGRAIGVASGAPPEFDDPMAMAMVLPDVSSGLKCSFCGKSGTKVSAIVVGDDARICNECLDLCKEILAEKPQPDST